MLEKFETTHLELTTFVTKDENPFIVISKFLKEFIDEAMFRKPRNALQAYDRLVTRALRSTKSADAVSSQVNLVIQVRNWQRHRILGEFRQVGDILALTGSATEAYGSTCSNFFEYFWPDSSQTVLNLLQMLGNGQRTQEPCK